MPRTNPTHRPLPAAARACRFLAIAVCLVAPIAAFGDPTFHHIQLNTTNNQRAVEWYVQHIGGEPAKHGVFNAVQLENGLIVFNRARIGFPGSEGRTVEQIALTTDDLDRTLQAAAEMGVIIVQGTRTEKNLRVATIEDPWGTRIELIEKTGPPAIHHIRVRATDREATLEWLTGTLGGTIENFQNDPGNSAVRFGDFWVVVRGVSENGEPEQAYSIGHIAWKVENFDEIHQRLMEEERPIALGPVRYPNSSLLQLEGPDKLTVELIEPR